MKALAGFVFAALSMVGLAHQNAVVTPPSATVSFPRAVLLSAAAPAAPIALAHSSLKPVTGVSRPVSPGIVLGTSTIDGVVTQSQLQTAIEQASNALRKLIFADAGTIGQGQYSTGGYTNNIALTNRIDKLNGTTLTNVAVNGVSGLSTSDISGLTFGTATDVTQNMASIAAWGDSLTAGANVTTPYPTTLSNLTSHYVFNGGIGGETAAQISARMLLDTGKYSWPALIWSGRNDVEITDTAAVEASIAAMVAALTTPYYIILPIFNNGGEPSGSSGYLWIQQVNDNLAATYGSHFLDAREYLVTNGLADAGITPTAQDLADIANDIPPTSLRQSSPTVHLNDAGYAVLAGYIAQHADLLYSSSGSSSLVTNAALQSLFSHASSFNSVNTLSNFAINGNQVLWSSPDTFSMAVGNGAGRLFTSTNVRNTAVGYTALGSTTSATLSDTGVGYAALYGDYGTGGNTALGAYAMQFMATGTLNIGIGFAAGRYMQSGTQNNAIGNFAMNGIVLGAGNTGSNNNAFGAYALYKNTTGSSNSAIGTNSLFANTTGGLNIAVGPAALNLNTTGSSNIAIGNGASRWNLSATSTVAIGESAGAGFLQNFNAQGYVIIGASAGLHIASSSNYNVMVGYQSGYNVTTGANNILIGGITTTANANLTTGSNNISIGHNISLPLATGSNQLNIQNVIYGSGNSGAGSTFSTGTVGVGATSTPWARFSIAGAAGGTLPLFAISSSTSGFATSTALIIDRNGKLGLGTSTPWRTLSVTGTVGLDGLAGATGSGSLCLDANKQVVYNSGSDACLSSLRATKHDITDLTLDGTSTIAALKSVSFIYNNDASSTVRYGFIAEDTAAVDQHLATHDAAGAISGIDDRAIISILVKAVQQLIGRLANLEAMVAGFANKFTTKQLCVEKSDGTPVCITGDQLSNILSDTPSVQISAPTPPIISGTTTPPSIDIQGNNPATINVGDDYIDLGAIVYDNQGHDLSYRTFINGALSGNILIDTSQVATTTIDYVATDTWGSASTSTRTVIVQAASSSLAQ